MKNILDYITIGLEILGLELLCSGFWLYILGHNFNDVLGLGGSLLMASPIFLTLLLEYMKIKYQE